MAKKSFLINPADMYFSAAATAPAQENNIDPNQAPAEAAQNPAAAAAQVTAPEAKETKTRRVQLLLPPSLWEQFSELAYQQRLSRNEAVIAALKKYMEDNA